MYFENFPVIMYDSVGKGDFKFATNLLRRVGLRNKIKSNVLIIDTYDNRSCVTPEENADKLYENSELYWVILVVKNITDR